MSVIRNNTGTPDYNQTGEATINILFNIEGISLEQSWLFGPGLHEHFHSA